VALTSSELPQKEPPLRGRWLGVTGQVQQVVVVAVRRRARISLIESIDPWHIVELLQLSRIELNREYGARNAY
jgi:hypothetical protein